jgi:hypothetical protein
VLHWGRAGCRRRGGCLVADAQSRSPGDLEAGDLSELVRLLDLVPVPEALVPMVLSKVKAYRASMARFEQSGIDVADVVTAQPYRADPSGGPG